MEISMKESVKIKVKINEEDIYYYGKYSFFKRPITLVVLSINVLVLLSLLAIAAMWHSFNILLIFFLWLGLLMLIIFLTLPKSLKNSAKRSVTSSEFKNFEREYIFSKQGISVKEEEENSNTLWESIYKVVETKYNFQIYVDLVQAYLIPKRCFNEDNEQINSFKKILVSSIPENKLKIKAIGKNVVKN